MGEYNGVSDKTTNKVSDFINTKAFIDEVNSNDTHIIFEKSNSVVTFYYIKVTNIRDVLSINTKEPIKTKVGAFYNVTNLGVLVGYILILPAEYVTTKTISYASAHKPGFVNCEDSVIVMSNPKVLVINSAKKSKMTDEAILLVVKGNTFIDIRKLIGK